MLVSASLVAPLLGPVAGVSSTSLALPSPVLSDDGSLPTAGPTSSELPCVGSAESPPTSSGLPCIVSAESPPTSSELPCIVSAVSSPTSSLAFVLLPLLQPGDEASATHATAKIHRLPLRAPSEPSQAMVDCSSASPNPQPQTPPGSKLPYTRRIHSPTRGGRTGSQRRQFTPQQRLYFLPLPQEQGSLRPG